MQVEFYFDLYVDRAAQGVVHGLLPPGRAPDVGDEVEIAFAHDLAPIDLQVAAVSSYDRDGSPIASVGLQDVHLESRGDFKRLVVALEESGYRWNPFDRAAAE